jgi:hypothetical protein
MKITNLKSVKADSIATVEYRRFEMQLPKSQTTLFKQLKLIEKLLFEISYFVILVRLMHSIKKRRWIDHQIVVSCSKQ